MAHALAVALSLLLVQISTSPAIPAHASSRAFTVVATAYPLSEVAAFLGGKRIHAVNLLPLDAYSAPNERQRKTLREADLAIALPVGMQPHLDEILFERTKPTMRLPDESLVPTRAPWLDPQYQWESAERIRVAMSQMDPAGASAFARRGIRYALQAVRVDRELSQWFASCKRREVLASTHDFDLLFARYGITVKVAPLETLSLEEKAEHEVYYTPKLVSLAEARQIRDQHGLRVAALSTVAAQPDEARRAVIDYPAAMLINLEALRSGMDCAPRWKLRR